MADLRLTFTDVYTKVSEFIGWGSSPGTTNLALAKDVVHRGYRRFLHPINMQTGRAHLWSFLKKSTVLVTESGKWVYNLPVDFNRLRIPFKHEADSGYPYLVFTSEDKIIQYRAGAATTGYPHFFAIRVGTYVKEIGTTYEVIFFETPNSTYPLVYSYIFRPSKLVETTDLFIGGDLASEAILESCLAVAEIEYDDTIGIHHQEADRLIQQLMQADTPTTANTVGKNLDTNIRYISYERPLPLTLSENIYGG